ncbi:sodium:solute symporter family protein [Isoptericola dokdonensis]|jgi:SSS family solute:Na+ symporter|uniref:Sodium/glucose cotransporter n=1 Tax=Isoptericola dokdonensis DS-3 TaxID=1300344 RepID=A0A161HRG7_9MICO|nr:sodium:solute symporter family protein [Isoptericola dokdonensis]ANC31892.1 Sodium/glucose cotransporter [Isoptericola dokdonensis DS-3]
MIITGVALTVLLVLVVGIAVARKVDGDSANYLVAGRQLGIPLVAVALTTAAVDSNATVGNTDMSSGYGFWAGASLALGLAICLLLAGLFLAKPMNRMGLLTLGDFFARRYNRPVELVASLLMVFAFTILLAGNLVAMGFLVEYFTGMPYIVGVVLAVCLVLAYTIGGGLFSDAYTAVIQAVITGVATVALFVWVASTWGITIPEGMGPFDLGQLTDPAQGAAINWATLVSLGIGDLVAIDFMQRIFGAKTPEGAQKACFIGAGATAVVGVLWSLIALTTVAELGLSAADAPIIYQLLDDFAPALLAILVLSGIVAASFSTASGAILATSAVAVRNIAGVRREVAPGHHDPLLRWTRIAMLPVVLVGIFLAVRVSQTGILLTLAFDLMLACLIAPFLLGLFWRRSTSTAALVGAGVGFVVRVTFLALTPTLYGVPNTLLYVDNDLVTADFDGWATLVAAAAGVTAFVVTALLTRPRAEEEIDLRHVDRTATDAPVPVTAAPAPAGTSAEVPVALRSAEPLEA